MLCILNADIEGTASFSEPLQVHHMHGRRLPARTDRCIHLNPRRAKIVLDSKTLGACAYNSMNQPAVSISEKRVEKMASENNFEIDDIL